MKRVFATRAKAARAFLPVALAGVFTGDADPVFTTRLDLVGATGKRFTLTGPSNQRLTLRGASQRRNTLEGASR